MSKMKHQILTIRLSFQDIFVFLVLWEFFFSDNELLRLYPYVFWPIASLYAGYKLKNISSSSLAYIAAVLVSMIYGAFSAFLSGVGVEGELFVVEIALYILPAAFICERCEEDKLIRLLCFFTELHLALLFLQFLLPNIFYVIEGITSSSELLYITQSNANTGVFMGLTGQTSTISFYLGLGIALRLYRFGQNRSVLNLIFILLFFVGILLTNRRGSLVCALALIIIYLFLGKERVSVKAISIVVVSTLVLMIGIQNIPGAENMINKFAVLQERNHLLSGRDQLWDLAIQLFSEHKLFGIGLGGYSQHIDVVNAHNSYLQKLCELGIVGAVIYMLPFIRTYIMSVYYAIRRRTNKDWVVNYYNDLNLLVVLLQSFFFILSITEGVFETPAFYVIIFIVQLFAVRIIAKEKRTLNNAK